MGYEFYITVDTSCKIDNEAFAEAYEKARKDLIIDAKIMKKIRKESWGKDDAEKVQRATDNIEDFFEEVMPFDSIYFADNKYEILTPFVIMRALFELLDKDQEATIKCVGEDTCSWGWNIKDKKVTNIIKQWVETDKDVTFGGG